MMIVMSDEMLYVDNVPLRIVKPLVDVIMPEDKNNMNEAAKKIVEKASAILKVIERAGWI